MAAPKAMAPITLGEPASSRSGGSVQITSSRSTRSTAPPPARKGSPVVNTWRGPIKRAGAVGRVELVAAEGDEVGPRWEATVRCELCRIEQDRDAAGVRLRTDLLDRRQPPGDVRGAGHGEQLGPRAGIEHGGDVVDAERPVGPALDPTPLRHPGPGEQVGVVLHHRRHDDVVGCELQPVGQMVDGLGGVAAQHHDVVVLAPAPGEAMGALAGALVGGGGPAGLVARPRGARSSTRGGSPPPRRPPPAWPVSRRRNRGRGRGGRSRRGRGRAVPPRPGRPWAPRESQPPHYGRFGPPAVLSGRGRAL